MEIIIAGSRDFEDYNFLKKKLDFLLSNVKMGDIRIISGTAYGADRLGEKYAKEKGYGLLEFRANWEKYGKRSGYIRNEEMAKNATHCVVFRVNESKGSSHMIEIAKRYNLGLRVYDFKRGQNE